MAAETPKPDVAVDALSAAVELASKVKHQRELAAARQQRHRDKRRDGAAAVVGQVVRLALPPAPSSAAEPAPPPDIRPAGVNASGKLHHTQPLEKIGTTPEAFTEVPPHVDHVAAPAPVDVEGAEKFAALVGFVFKLALDDATVRYDLASSLGAATGAEVGNVEELKAAAVAFVHQRAKRCAIKHGFGLNVPYEDELVTVLAGAGSAVYLMRKYTGRLGQGSQKGEPGDAPGRAPGARRRPSAAPGSAAARQADDDGPESEAPAESSFNTLRVDPGGPKGEVPSWLAS